MKLFDAQLLIHSNARESSVQQTVLSTVDLVYRLKMEIVQFLVTPISTTTPAFWIVKTGSLGEDISTLSGCPLLIIFKNYKLFAIHGSYSKCTVCVLTNTVFTLF